MTDPDGRRTGPRRDVDVPTLVLDTAERLFAEQSVGATSVRAVAREAGVAHRAVAYHFPSKGALLRAVVHRRAVGVGEEVRAGLQALVDADGQVSVEALVRAVLTPFARLLDREPVAGLAWLKTYTHLAIDEDPVVVEENLLEPNLVDLFLAAARRALPDLDEEELATRSGLAIYSMLGALAGTDLAGYGRPLTPAGLDRRFVERLVAFTARGLASDARRPGAM